MLEMSVTRRPVSHTCILLLLLLLLLLSATHVLLPD